MMLHGEYLLYSAGLDPAQYRKLGSELLPVLCSNPIQQDSLQTTKTTKNYNKFSITLQLPPTYTCLSIDFFVTVLTTGQHYLHLFSLCPLSLYVNYLFLIIVHPRFRLRFDFPHGGFRVLPVGIERGGAVLDFLKETGSGVEEADALFKTALQSSMFVPYLCLDVLDTL
jgi:hypothetical protein